MSAGDSQVPQSLLEISPSQIGGGRPALPPISPTVVRATSGEDSNSAREAVDASRRSRVSVSSVVVSAGADGGHASPPGARRASSRSSSSHMPPRSPRGVTSPSPPSPSAEHRARKARRPSSIMGSRRPSVTPSRRSSTFSQAGLHRENSAHRPWEPREARDPRPWTPRASITTELTPEIEAAIEREMGRECQILWCSPKMHAWYAFVIVLPMLVALGVGIWARYEWLQATAAVVLAIYVVVYVAGLLNLVICGRDCRHDALKTRTAAYCEALLMAVVPVAVMIALIVYISVTKK